MGSGASLPWFESLVVKPESSHLISAYLGFLKWKIGLLLVFNEQTYALGTAWHYIALGKG